MVFYSFIANVSNGWICPYDSGYDMVGLWLMRLIMSITPI